MKVLRDNIIEKLYLIIMMGICLLPLVGLAWYHAPAANVEKRALAELPKAMEKGRPNIHFFQDMGSYFEEHFAYRDYMVAADSVAMADVFNTAAVDTIVLGENGWLYYRDSVRDYQCSRALDERGAIALARNISLIQKKISGEGRRFVFTVAPNKNSLYGKNMPSNLKYRAGRARNIERVAPMLKEYGVNYVDLFDALGSRDEVLYRMQDSHWNGEGAVCAYNTILDYLRKKHETYEGGRWKKSKTKRGDLATSLYGIFADPEWDMEENEADKFIFKSETDYWEEAPFVETFNKTGRGSVYMYRDSFGITLGPLMANAYRKGCFSGETIYHLDMALANYRTDTVIMEIVERNLRHFVNFNVEQQSVSVPPIMSLRAKKLEKIKNFGAERVPTDTTVNRTKCELQRDYDMIYGTLDEEKTAPDARIYVRLSMGAKRQIYEAYLTVDPDTNADCGFLAYIPQDELQKADGISVIDDAGKNGREIAVLEGKNE